MENAITGADFNVYRASGISSCKIKFEKSGRKACHSHGNGTSEAMHWLHVLHTSHHCLSYNLPVHSPHTPPFCPRGEDKCSCKEETYNSHSHKNSPTSSFDTTLTPCLFLKPLTYSYYQDFTSCLVDCHRSTANTSATNTHFPSWIAALF